MPARPWLSLLVLCLGTFAILLDTTIVNVVLPRIPADTPPSLTSRLERLNTDVFAHGYLAAMLPTLAVSVAVLLAGDAACLLRRHPVPPPATPDTAGAAAHVPAATTD